MAGAKRPITYKTKYAFEFGVKIYERDDVSKAEISMSCLFCIHFDREE